MNFNFSKDLFSRQFYVYQPEAQLTHPWPSKAKEISWPFVMVVLITYFPYSFDLVPVLLTEHEISYLWKMWEVIQENEDVSVLFKDNSKNKETIVLRVFEQTTSSKERMEAFKNNLEKITQARNRLLEISGGGRQRHKCISPITNEKH